MADQLFVITRERGRPVDLFAPGLDHARGFYRALIEEWGEARNPITAVTADGQPVDPGAFIGGDEVLLHLAVVEDIEPEPR